MSSSDDSQPRRAWLVGLIGLAAAGGIGWSIMRDRGTGQEAPVIEKGLPVLIDFGMDICAQCKKTRAMIEALAPGYEGRLQVRFLDVREDANEALAMQYGMRVIPLVVLLDAAGREVWRHEGQPEEKVLREQIDAVTGAGPRSESTPCSEDLEACTP